MAITTDEHRIFLELEQIRADIEQTRVDTRRSSKKLHWYEKIIYIGIGGLAFNGLSGIIEAIIKKYS